MRKLNWVNCCNGLSAFIEYISFSIYKNPLLYIVLSKIKKLVKSKWRIFLGEGVNQHPLAFLKLKS